jgi:hypothetical protein
LSKWVYSTKGARREAGGQTHAIACRVIRGADGPAPFGPAQRIGGRFLGGRQLPAQAVFRHAGACGYGELSKLPVLDAPDIKR